ncbi:MAG: tRNA (adenosine(37)-N6)-threonylcarbamoyltransferase complex transferase subunit TsaD [Cytophagales bacterium]|nr:tRNA (adenosine(37)-N6)-threonylcarbamoyltransferase complex transferase subunit TsaD [Cytophagales bacterium]
MYILGIETSCDETAASVSCNGSILSNVVATQIVHSPYGGVVPELASRMHERSIVSVTHQAIHQANIQKNDITAISFTQGPGLLGSLLVGTCFAKGFAQALHIPLIAVDHMKAHIFAHYIDAPAPEYPFLCLTVSGGHTQIVLVNSFTDIKVIGKTLDDAVGEAFDKAAKIMDIPYPGGPLIDKYAQSGDKNRYRFPIAHIPDYDYSFSGVKTALLYFLRDNTATNADFIKNNIHDICASYQHTLIQTLLLKLKKASKDLGINRIAIAGGVAANSYLRAQLLICANEHWEIFIPKLEYCTDNAAMIAHTGYMMYLNNQFADLKTVAKAVM